MFDEIRNIGGDEMIEALKTYQGPRSTAKALSSRKASARRQKNSQAEEDEFMAAQRRVQRGLEFANDLPRGADAHYAGKGVASGSAATPIFWYRPENSKKYRVIYADLSVRNADKPPAVPQVQPVLKRAHPQK